MYQEGKIFPLFPQYSWSVQVILFFPNLLRSRVNLLDIFQLYFTYFQFVLIKIHFKAKT